MPAQASDLLWTSREQATGLCPGVADRNSRLQAWVLTGAQTTAHRHAKKQGTREICSRPNFLILWQKIYEP